MSRAVRRLLDEGKTRLGRAFYRRGRRAFIASMVM